MLVDSHCHLEYEGLVEDQQGVLQRAREAGIRGFLNISTRRREWDQVVGTALLLLCICALTDDRNMAPKSNLAPLLIGAVVLMIGMSMGANCAYGINPARDLSPRVFTWLAGWGNLVFRSPNTTWYLVPILGPFLGGIIGAWLYHTMIARGHVDAEEYPAESV